MHELLARHSNLADFIDALKNMDRSQQDPLGRSPLLHMEMILFVARAEKRRPELAKRLRARRKLIVDIVETRQGQRQQRRARSRHGPAPSCWRWRTAFACIA